MLALSLSAHDPELPSAGRFCCRGVVEFRTAQGETLAISVPRGETAVLEHFRARMPYGLFVPETNVTGG